MNSSDGLTTESTRPPTKATVGIVATEGNDKRVLRTLTRALRLGNDVLLAYTAAEPPESIELAVAAGATVVAPRNGQADVGRLYRQLTNVAAACSYPGIVFVPPDSRDFDLERAIQHVESDAGFTVVGHPNEDPHRLNPDAIAVLLAYNEAETVGDVVRGATELVDRVFVIDDGSEDETAARARAAGASVVRHDTNRGYGSALQTAFRTAAGYDVDRLVVLDADGQHDATEIPALLDPLEDGDADLVIGSRFVSPDGTDLPHYRWAGLMVVNLLTNLSMGRFRPRDWIGDTQSGFRAFNGDAISSIVESGWLGSDMDASTDVLYHARREGLAVAEVGISISYDVENASSTHPLRHGVILVSNILRTVEREHPVLVLGIPGVVLVCFGLGFTYWTLANYVSTGTLSLGLGLAAVFSTLSGILACFTGIILHSLTVHFADKVPRLDA